ncbi:hypothetical protein [Streptomyces sp. NPDC005385]|uniref:hypothetical protein n=1 Tax=Streptomyces sp. NPDC005385 TaxID=3157039 RepID=UPI0033A568DA
MALRRTPRLWAAMTRAQGRMLGASPYAGFVGVGGWDARAGELTGTVALSANQVEDVLTATLESTPGKNTHWGPASVAAGSAPRGFSAVREDARRFLKGVPMRENQHACFRNE